MKTLISLTSFVLLMAVVPCWTFTTPTASTFMVMVEVVVGDFFRTYPSFCYKRRRIGPKNK